MRVAEDFLLSSPFSVSISSQEPLATLHLYTENEVSAASMNEVAYAKGIYSDLKAKNLYIASSNGQHFIYVLPQDTLKKLGQNAVGPQHLVTHWGGLISAAIQTPHFEKKNKVTIKASTSVQDILSSHAEHFVLALLQRSTSHKVATKAYDERLKKKVDVQLSAELCNEDKLEQGKALHESMLITRSVINMPPNILNPKSYPELISHLLKESNAFKNLKNVKMDILDSSKLEELGCGLITAVGKASSTPPCIIKLSYNPSKASKHLALVGKGITFDTGGLDLKGSGPMRNMKKDMGGSASALGSFLAIASLKTNINVTCYLAVAENMVSGNAMRPSDVYTARNGLTVEVDNTDAEGRLVLADAMCLAQEEKPDWMIDLATLTGAARIALGPQVDAMFSNDSRMAQLLSRMGTNLGDWVWELPLVDDYDSMYESNIAEFTNCSTSGLGGAITAAQFLKKFVKDTSWTHIDTYMWNDKPSDLYSEMGAAAKCVRLITYTAEQLAEET